MGFQQNMVLGSCAFMLGMVFVCQVVSTSRRIFGSAAEVGPNAKLIVTMIGRHTSAIHARDGSGGAERLHFLRDVV